MRFSTATTVPAATPTSINGSGVISTNTKSSASVVVGIDRGDGVTELRTIPLKTGHIVEVAFTYIVAVGQDVVVLS